MGPNSRSLKRAATSHYNDNLGIPTQIVLTTTIFVCIGLEGAVIGNDG